MTHTEDRPLRFAQALTPQGLVADLLVSIDASGSILSTEQAPDDCPIAPLPGLALPGMPNLHSHAFQRAMAGLAEVRGRDDDSFWTWRDLMYRIASGIDPEDLQTIAEHLYIQLLEGGFTSIVEFHYLHHDRNGEPYDDPGQMSRRLLEAARNAGIGITLAPVLYQRGGFDDRALGHQQRRFRHTTDGFLRLLRDLECERNSQVELGLAIHSLRAVAMEQILHVLANAPADRPRHIHIAEQPLEVEECIAAHGARPVEWLSRHVDLGPEWTLIHATHLAPVEVSQLARSGAVAGLCPTTEANLGDGLFALEPFLQQDGQLGVGTDSHVGVNAAGELRWLEYGQRLVSGSRCLAQGDGQRDVAHFLWQRAARGGAIACGRPVGAIEAGRRADIVVIDSEHDANPHRLLQRHVFGTGLTRVSQVWVGGQHVVSEGEHHARRESAGRFRDCLEKIL